MELFSTPNDSNAAALGLLHRISRIVHSGLGLDQMLQELITLVGAVTACDACLVDLLDRDTEEVVLCASQLSHTAAIGNIRMKIGEGIAGWVARHQSVAALASEAPKDPRFRYFESLPEDTYDALLSVPLVNEGDLIGVINVHHRKRHEHGATEVALLSYVAEQLAGAVSKAALAAQNMKLGTETLKTRKKLEERKVTERAKGLLQQHHGITEEEAYRRLRNESRRTRRPMHEIAAAIILSAAD